MKHALFTAALATAASAFGQAPVLKPQPTTAPPIVAPPPAKVAMPPLRPRLTPHHHEARTSAAERRVVAANRAATFEPAASGYLNAVQVFPFVEGAVFHVFTAPGQVTDIALQPGEVLGAVAAGDTLRWIIGDTTSGSGDGKRTHVLLKPFAAGLSTNVIVTTDRRTYHLSLTSGARVAMVALSWTYPQDQLIALKAAAEQAHAAQPVASGLQIDQLHFGYIITGDQPRWRPLRAFDDGRQTFIEFPENLGVGEAPPLFLVDAKGTASLVNYRVQGRFYVVDRLFDAAELRLGLKHQDVVRISRASEADTRRRAS
jgi:P-type conjugative transfer protein TrbG